MKNMSVEKKIEYGIFFLVSILITVYMFYLQYHTPICFDGGMNFTVSRSLNETGKYATDYQEQELFAVRIQTGAPVIFATSILNLIFGINSNNMQIVTTIFGILLTMMIYVILSKKTDYFFAIITTVLLLSLTYYTNVSYLGIGETTMGFFILLFCCLLCKAEEEEKTLYYVLAGLCVGLGYLTKTIYLIIAPVVGLVLLMRLILKKGKLKNYLLVLLGALLPVVLFEVYRMSQMGMNAYVDWWKFMIMDILGQAGVTDQHTGTQVRNIDQFVHHIKVFCEYFNIHVVAFGFMYALPLISGIVEYRRNKKIELLILLIYGIGLIYIFWWVVMSPTVKLWPRRVLMGYVCAVISFAWAIWVLLKKTFDNKKVQITICVVVSLCLAFPIHNNFKESFVETHAHKKQYELYTQGVEYMKSLPDNSVFYGISWWENPTISGMSGLKMLNLEYGIDDYTNCYYVEEAIARSSYGIQGTQNMVMAQYDTDIVFQNGGLRIFRINGRKELDSADLAIKLNLLENSDCTFKFHYSSFEEDHGEINKSVYMAEKESEICVEIFSADVDKILLGIVSNKLATEIKVDSLSIKLENELLYYDGKELNELLKSSPSTSTIDIDENGNTIIKFDNSTQIFFDIH